MNNRYNDIMSRIEVDDEMRERILKNIASEGITSARGGINPVSSRNKAKITTIIGIVAAAGIVLTIGGVFVSKGLMTQNKSASPQMDNVAYGAETEAENIEACEDESTNNKTIIIAGNDQYEQQINTATGGINEDLDGHSFLAPESSIVVSDLTSFIAKATEISMYDYNGKTYTITDKASIGTLSGMFQGFRATGDDPAVEDDQIHMTIVRDDIIADMVVGSSQVVLEGIVFENGSRAEAVKDNVVSLFLEKGSTD